MYKKRGFKSFVSPLADFLALIIILDAFPELELKIGKMFISPAPFFKIDKTDYDNIEISCPIEKSKRRL